MKKLVYVALTILSITLFLVGLFLLYSTGLKVVSAFNGAQLEMIKMVIVPVVIAVAFLYTAKKLFINSFYQVIRK